MWLGKIGAKSAAFINHKPFHPGTFENLERVWLAEEKHRQEQQRQNELQERRLEEKKIHELRLALNSQRNSSNVNFKGTNGKFNDNQRISPETNSLEDFLKSSGRRKNKRRLRETKDSGGHTEAQNGKERDKPLICSRYQEDVLVGHHTRIFGSFFCLETHKWGYDCCKVTDRNGSCTKKSPIDVENSGKVPNNKKARTESTKK